MTSAHTTSRSVRAMGAAVAGAAAVVLLSAGTAVAAPVSPPAAGQHRPTPSCSMSLRQMQVFYVRHGFTAQAAKTAAALTRRACNTNR